MIEYIAFNKGELCNGSTADSDSVCWGSNPYSPAKEKRPPHGGLFSFLWLWNRLPNPSAEPLARHGVRISHPKVGVLAHQTQGVEIFATGEYPETERPPRGGLFSFLWLGIEDSHRSAESCEARGSHTPLVDRQARLSGGECGYLHKMNTPIPYHHPVVAFFFPHSHSGNTPADDNVKYS